MRRPTQFVVVALHAKRVFLEPARDYCLGRGREVWNPGRACSRERAKTADAVRIHLTRTARISRVSACDNRFVPLIRRNALLDRFDEMHRRLDARIEEMNRRGENRHGQLLERSRASERIFIEAMTDIDQSIKRSNERMSAHMLAIRDMPESIRADTQAVLLLLDRLGPAQGGA